MNKIKLPEFKGNNLLFHAVNYSNAVDCINLLQNKQADINARNVNGSTPLHSAVQTQNLNMVKIILKYGGDPNLKEYFDIGEKTPLHYSVQKNNYEITQLLLDSGANPVIPDKRGMTSLHTAARFGYKQIVKLLVSYGADVNLRDSNGFNAAQWAKLNQFKDIVDLIGPPKTIQAKDYQEYKNAMVQIHQITLGKKKKKKKKK